MRTLSLSVAMIAVAGSVAVGCAVQPDSPEALLEESAASDAPSALTSDELSSMRSSLLYRLRVRIVTANVAAGDSNGRVYVSINGVRTYINSGVDDFERTSVGGSQSHDRFYEIPLGALESVGDIRTFAVGNASADTFALSSVELWANDRGTETQYPYASLPSQTNAFRLASMRGSPQLAILSQSERAIALNPTCDPAALRLAREVDCGRATIDVPGVRAVSLADQSFGNLWEEHHAERYSRPDREPIWSVHSEAGVPVGYRITFNHRDSAFGDEPPQTVYPCSGRVRLNDFAEEIYLSAPFQALPNWICNGGGTVAVQANGSMRVRAHYMGCVE